MINIIAKGTYRLVGTKDRQKMLYLDHQGYLWSYAKGIGELLSFSKHPHKTAYILAEGKYRIYEVKNEPTLVDLQHLELSVGTHSWQGYLLLTGLPTAKKIRRKIVATGEIINSPKRRSP